MKKYRVSYRQYVEDFVDVETTHPERIFSDEVCSQIYDHCEEPFKSVFEITQIVDENNKEVRRVVGPDGKILFQRAKIEAVYLLDGFGGFEQPEAKRKPRAKRTKRAAPSRRARR